MGTFLICCLRARAWRENGSKWRLLGRERRDHVDRSAPRVFMSSDGSGTTSGRLSDPPCPDEKQIGKDPSILEVDDRVALARDAGVDLRSIVGAEQHHAVVRLDTLAQVRHVQARERSGLLGG